MSGDSGWVGVALDELLVEPCPGVKASAGSSAMVPAAVGVGPPLVGGVAVAVAVGVAVGVAPPRVAVDRTA